MKSIINKQIILFIFTNLLILKFWTNQNNNNEISPQKNYKINLFKYLIIIMGKERDRKDIFFFTIDYDLNKLYTF